MPTIGSRLRLPLVQSQVAAFFRTPLHCKEFTGSYIEDQQAYSLVAFFSQEVPKS